MQLVVSNVGYVVSDNANRKRLTLLDQVEFVLNPGEFLCILGPSGSGKSTLLNVISGRRSATSGKVYVNGRDLHGNFAALKQDLSVVPQSSTLHETLTVEQSFRFTSELRLPADLSQDELRATVARTLETVGLTPRRKVRISQLSGGQLKRTGLGGELLSEPSLLFLDEVTSGLDEHSDGEMMRLFRELIYHRERDYNLLPEAYLLSKLIFLATIGVVQTLLLATLTLTWFGLPGSFVSMIIVLTASSLAGTSLGLAISASAKNEEVAVALVPIVIIPQIILAGVVATLPAMSDWIARIFVTIFWSQQAVEACLPEADRVPSESLASFGSSISLILLHSACFLLVAWWGVRKPARK